MSDISNLESIQKFDIITFARGILDEIESMRSYEKRFDGKTKESYQVPTESRLNAFFRMIGLPMFVYVKENGTTKASKSFEGNKVLTPGYDSELNAKLSSYTIKNSNDVSGNNIELENAKRMFLLQQRDGEIGTPTMNENMTFALAAPIPLVPNLTNEFGGLTNIKSGILPERETYKRLFPLITNHMEIVPSNRQFARPFLLDTRSATIANDVLSKPFIETVIRIRLGIGAGTPAMKGQNDDFINSIKNSIGPELFNSTFGDTVSVLEQANILEIYILNKLLTSINQISKRWVSITEGQSRLLNEVPLTIYVKTTSAKNNPLGKRMSVSLDSELLQNSAQGRKLQSLQFGLAVGESLVSLMPSDDSSNPTNGQAVGQTKNITKSALNNPFLSLLNADLSYYQNEINTMKEEIQKYVNLAERIRVESELMTGEFTGISVIDVVAVIIGLFMINKNDLLSLLDSDVKEKMQADATMKSALSGLTSPNSIQTEIENAYTAVQNLEKQVENIFSLINSQVVQIKNKGKRNKNINAQKQNKSSEPPKSVSISEQYKNVGNKVGES